MCNPLQNTSEKFGRHGVSLSQCSPDVGPVAFFAQVDCHRCKCLPGVRRTHALSPDFDMNSVLLEFMMSHKASRT